ncbi:dolichyl-phosphate-mannose--protein mannosyltransferase [Nocardia sp. NPDC088792]|uniref:dolichyl-phosphate-mannose--protein mannosyltransferase n=1 Tax=Nocardia sp. NPDC088792 TaxID=3364332 RepID=UPI0038022B79
MTQATDARPATLEAGTAGPPPLSSPAPLRPSPDFGPTDWARGWAVTLFLTLVAGLTRFIMLGYPTDAHTPVFDEKHYAPQGWQVLTGGGVEDNPGYGLVVHPPVGKQMIALGEWIFGYSGWGWRFTAAVSGTLMVLLVIRIVRRMTRSTLIGAFAGILLICDGLTFVSSRLGMLDIFQALFVLAAFGCLIVDRDEMRERIALVDVQGRLYDSEFGPRFGVRWWRFGAGVLLGLACGTKWSGAYWVIGFAAMSLAFDLAARRGYRVRRPWAGVAVRDLGPTVYSLVLIPFLVYMASFWGWFANEDSYDRYAVGVKVGHGGDFSWVPPALRGLWYYGGEVLTFHEGLTNSAGNHHPWESKPWTWFMGLRPMLYYYADGNVTGCGQSQCVKAVMAIGTPALWWLAFPVLGWALWRSFVRRDWRYAAVLVGYVFGIAPWFLNLDRQMYFFYAVPLAPFLAMAMALVLGDILGHAPPSGRRLSGAPEMQNFLPPVSERQGLGLLLVSIYLALVIANFIWLWPILTAMPITVGSWHDHLWLPSWR